jgi:OPA family sugar phosphate sensor protein UhpC-like MFS transporter
VLRFFAPPPAAPALTDAALVDELYRRKRRTIFLAITLGYAFSYTLRLGLSVVKKPLIDGGLFTVEQFGLIGSALFYSYAFGKLTNGVLADHANMKRFLPVGLAVSALINFALPFNTALAFWVAMWALNGWFQGFGTPGGVVTLTSWFGRRERGRFYGLWSTAHSLGEGMTFVVSAALVSGVSWRAGFQVPALVCLAVALAMYFVLEDKPQSIGLPPVGEWRGEQAVAEARAGDEGRSRAQLDILKRPAIWILGLASAAMYVTRYAINSWGVLYLQEARGYGLVEAGSLLGLNTLFGILGCTAYGFISDTLFAARRPPVNFIFGVVEVMAIAVFFLVPGHHPWIVGTAMAVYGFTLSGLLASLGGLFATDIASKKAAGATMGFIGVFSYLAAGAQERISAGLIERGITWVDGVRHYDFGAAIVFWIGGSVVSLVLASTLWRTRAAD